MNPFTPRSDEQPWFRVGELAVTTTILICAGAALSMFVLAAAPAALDPLALVPELVRRGEVWRVVTYFIPNPASLSAVIWIFMVFIFGRELEGPLGRTRYLWFVGVVTVLPAALVSAVGLFPANEFGVAGGAAGLRFLEIAVFTAFIATMPTARGFFGIPLWVFGAVFVGIDILQLVGNRAWDSLILLLLVLATSALMIRALGLCEIAQIPKIPLPAFITGDPYQKANRKRERAQKQQRKQRGPAPVVPIRSATDADEAMRQADLDMLLDKISATGLDSLTADERTRLERHSKRGR